MQNTRLHRRLTKNALAQAWFWLGFVLLLLVTSERAFATSLNVQVNASANDEEEAPNGSIDQTSGTFNLASQPWVGLRFTAVAIPQYAYIKSAYVTFTCSANDATAAPLTVYGEAANNSGAFTTTTNDLSARSRTTASVSWSVASWSSGSAYNSAELRSIIQEIVNRGGWASGNNLSILFQSNDTSKRRRAKTYDNSTTLCPLLHVDYVVVTRPVATRLLFVVTSTSSPTAFETQRQQFFQDIGYTVTLIASTASQSTFDTSAAANDLAYISEAITSTDVNTKLKSKPLGIVNEEPALSDDFAVSSTYGSPSASTITIAKNNHYITNAFSTGSLTITSSAQTMTTWTGTVAPDLDTLATIGGAPSLVAVEINGKLYDGTTAAGRRVFLPWSYTIMDLTLFNDNGYLLLSRALAWAGGVVGYWRLDETTGTTASDSTVNLLQGTVTNFSFDTSGVSAAKVNRGLTFNGSTNYITKSNTSTLQLTKALSISAWIKGTSWPSGTWVGSILRKGDDNPNNYQLAVENGYIALGLDGNDGSNPHGNTALSTGVWYHVVGTWDGTNVKLYVNGVLDSTATTHFAPIGTDTRPLYIGGRTSDDWFNGVLDDVRLFNHALDADEVTVLKGQGGQFGGVRLTKWIETQ